MLPLRFVFIFRAASLSASLSIICSAFCSAQSVSTIAVEESAARVTFPGNSIQLALPVVNRSAPLAAQVTAELLDPTDAVLSHAEQPCAIADGRTICRIAMPAAISNQKNPAGYTDDLPLFRIRYRVVTPGATPLSGILALDRIAPDLFELHVASTKDTSTARAYLNQVLTGISA